MAKAMVITVGTGRYRTDIALAISFSISRENPGTIVFLTSEKTATETIPEIDQTVLAGKIVRVDTFKEIDEIEPIYLHYIKTIHALMNEGFQKEDIIIDYTSGTKSMSAALFAAGIALEVASVNYVTGERDETGRVIPDGKSQLVSINPLAILAENKIEKAQNLFNLYQFVAAEALLTPLLNSIEAALILNRVNLLLRLIRAYALWDTFKLTEAKKLFGKINAENLLKKHPVHEPFQRNFDLLQLSASNSYSVQRIVDLLCNVNRRMEEGKYDDALARIYRLFECMAQVKLFRDHDQLETARIPLEKLPDSLRAKYEKESRDNAHVQLANVKTFELLADLGDPMGAEFMREYSKQVSPLRNLLNKRNKSILAHGFQPIDKENCDQLIDLLVGFLDHYFQQWGQEQAKAIFPKL